MGQIDEAMLLKALQARLLADIERRQEAAITNNVYGAGPQGSSSGGMGGLAAEMQRGSPVSDSGDDPFDYFVNINRRDVFDPSDPEGKKKLGWDKEVHRYRAPKDDHKPSKKAKRGK